MVLPKIGVKVRVVPYRPEHANSLFSWFYDFRYKAFFREYEDKAYTLDDFRQWGDRMERGGFGFFTILDKETGTPIGLMTHTCLKRKAGVWRFGIMLDEKYQRHTYAIECIIVHGFYLVENFGCKKLTIEFLESDKQIQRIAEKGGFVREGILAREAFVDGQYVDEARYYISDEIAYELYGSYHAALEKA